jgi:hypothetical protein
MKTRRKGILAGVVLYILSFFLPAIVFYHPNGHGGFVESPYPGSGYFCAVFAFEPLAELFNGNTQELHSNPVAFFARLVSGFINPVFWISMIVEFKSPGSNVGLFLKIALLFMLVAPVIVFQQHPTEYRPTIGYFVWTAAMLIVLSFSKWKKPQTARE